MAEAVLGIACVTGAKQTGVEMKSTAHAVLFEDLNDASVLLQPVIETASKILRMHRCSICRQSPLLLNNKYFLAKKFQKKTITVEINLESI